MRIVKLSASAKYRIDEKFRKMTIFLNFHNLKKEI